MTTESEQVAEVLYTRDEIDIAVQKILALLTIGSPEGTAYFSPDTHHTVNELETAVERRLKLSGALPVRVTHREVTSEDDTLIGIAIVCMRRAD
jgi:hypothetical protein